MKQLSSFLKLVVIGVVIVTGLTGCVVTNEGFIGKTRPGDQPSYWSEYWDRATASSK